MSRVLPKHNCARFQARLRVHVVKLQASTTGSDSSGRNNVGFAIAFYHFRFADEVISPVVYTSSSPFFDIFYRGIGDNNRLTFFLAFSLYTAALNPPPPGDEFAVFNSNGDADSFTRSLHQARGSHVVLGGEYRGRVATFGDGNTSLHVGGSFEFGIDEFSGTDNWASGISWDRTRSWNADFSLSLGGLIERRFRESDRFSLDLSVTVLSLVSRPPYYYPLDSPSDISPGALQYSWLPPNEFLRWSARVSYEYWFTRSIGLMTYYRFQHQRVTEPRDLRSVSHTLSLGGAYAF